MSLLSSFSPFSGGGGTPMVTTYTSGTGTFVPSVDNARCVVFVQGAGGGGGRGTNGSSLTASGGSAGAMLVAELRIPIAGVPYSVGAAGVGSTNPGFAGTGGAKTVFAAITANPGAGGSATSGLAEGGAVGLLRGSNVAGGLGYSGGGGGNGGTAVNGVAGSATNFVFNAANGTAAGGVADGSYGGGGGAGDSYFGRGGAGGNGGASTGVAGSSGSGYGSGGGGGGGGGTTSGNGGNGGGGYIEIWDFGA